MKSARGRGERIERRRSGTWFAGEGLAARREAEGGQLDGWNGGERERERKEFPLIEHNDQFELT